MTRIPIHQSSLFASSCLVLFSSALVAQEPGWNPRVLKRGEDRAVSEQTPLLERPYRPLHFYGNAVRRNYYRGNPWPLPRDLIVTTALLAPNPRERENQFGQRLATPGNPSSPSAAPAPAPAGTRPNNPDDTGPLPAAGDLNQAGDESTSGPITGPERDPDQRKNVSLRKSVGPPSAAPTSWRPIRNL